MASRAERLARANRVAEAALDRKAQDLVALDVSELTSYADTLIIATATSDRHARAVADAIAEAERDRAVLAVGLPDRPRVVHEAAREADAHLENLSANAGGNPLNFRSYLTCL